MKVDRSLFKSKGIKCDLYADYIDSLNRDFSEGTHHVYPVSIFGERGELLKCSPEEHSHAHLLLALDNENSDFENRDVCNAVLGLSARFRMSSQTCSSEDYKIYQDKGKDIVRKAQSSLAKHQWAEMSEEMGKSISESKNYKWENDPDYRERISKAQSGNARKLWEEHKEEQSQKFREGWTPEVRQRKSEQMKELYSRPEMKEKLSEVAKKRMTPELTSRIEEAKRSPKGRKKREFHKCVYILENSLDKGLSITDQLYQREWIDSENKGLMFHYYGYLLRNLGMEQSTIDHYKTIFARPERPYSEDMEIWGKLTDESWQKCKEYITSMNV